MLHKNRVKKQNSYDFISGHHYQLLLPNSGRYAASDAADLIKAAVCDFIP